MKACPTRERTAGRGQSAFLGSYREERSGFLVDMFAAAFRALNLVLFVFRQTENQLKRLLAIFAIKLIAGHGNLRTSTRGVGLVKVYARGTSVSRIGTTSKPTARSKYLNS